MFTQKSLEDKLAKTKSQLEVLNSEKTFLEKQVTDLEANLESFNSDSISQCTKQTEKIAKIDVVNDELNKLAWQKACKMTLSC